MARPAAGDDLARARGGYARARIRRRALEFPRRVGDRPRGGKGLGRARARARARPRVEKDLTLRKIDINNG